jgi:C-terminal processing protease CtpA/Prc
MNTKNDYNSVTKSMKNLTTINARLAVLWLSLLLVAAACSKNDPAPNATTQANNKVNTWILDNMQFWYLWNTSIPASPDKNQDPDVFFKSLLSTQDRFSWIQPDYKDLLNSLQGVTKEAGYEFVLYKADATTDNVIAQILYIKPGSPAETEGLKRGDVITQINDQQITVSNYKTLLTAISDNHSIHYKPLLVDDQKFDTEKTVSLNTVEYSENPNYLNKVIAVNDKKIGYYVYNFFAAGVDGGTAYDTEMENIFTSFKGQGITDLVLDLRFNSGGSETSADNLASFIGKGIDGTTIFAKRTYNTQVQDQILNDPKLGQSYLTTKFISKSANIGSMLSGGKVYVLTSSHTASASELVINALKPFMEVFLIGDVTYGKNVGSISIYDETDPGNTWGLQPIVVKVSNSLDQSDYSNGFTPNVLDKDNSLYIRPLGDPNEALLSQAIAQITGTASTGRVAARKELKEIVGHSLDTKARSFNLNIDKNIPEIFKVQ